jgi:exosortase
LTTLSNAAQIEYATPRVESGRSGNEGGSSENLPKGWLGIPVRAWLMAAFLAVAFTALYWPSLRRLWIKTNPIDGSAEWAHAIFVPIVGLYYLFLNLDDLLKAKVRPLLGLDFTKTRFISVGALLVSGAILAYGLPRLPGPFANYAGEFGTLGSGVMALAGFVLVFDWGVGTLLAGLLTYAYGIAPGANDFIKDVGMIMSLIGAVLTITGWDVMRIAWFPLVFLFCALPWPGLFYSKLAMPMQQFSAEVAVAVMQITGVDVENSGTQIIITKPNMPLPRILNVAEACAGLKSLMTFVSLGASVAFLSARPLWQKLVITFSAVPIAVMCNALRVSGQGMLDYYVSEIWSAGFAHQFAGLVMLLPGFAALMGVVWLLDKLFVDGDEDEADVVPATVGGAA